MGKFDFDEIYRLAEEQSVIGIIAAGLNHVVDSQVPKQDLFQFIGVTLQQKERNKEIELLDRGPCL